VKGTEFSSSSSNRPYLKSLQFERLVGARGYTGAMTLVERVGSEHIKHGRPSINRGFYHIKVCDERKFLSGMATGVTDYRRKVQVAPGVRDRCRFAVDIVSQADAGYSCR
jgi:hypothetical protein